jgi:hypothetical protein
MSTAEAMVACCYYLISYLFNADKAFVIDWILPLVVRLIVKQGKYPEQKRRDEAEQSHAADCTHADEDQEHGDCKDDEHE